MPIHNINKFKLQIYLKKLLDQFQLRVAPLKFVINNEIFPNYLDYHNLPVKDFLSTFKKW